MTITEAASAVGGTVANPDVPGATAVRGGYASDLLSDVMANAEDGDVWVTMQRHVNVVAVAQLKNLAGIVIVGGRDPEPGTVARATEHGVTIVTTALTAFDAVGRLYQLGLRGRQSA
jgi:hypothetical protein